MPKPLQVDQKVHSVKKSKSQRSTTLTLHAVYQGLTLGVRAQKLKTGSYLATLGVNRFTLNVLNQNPHLNFKLLIIKTLYSNLIVDLKRSSNP